MTTYTATAAPSPPADRPGEGTADHPDGPAGSSPGQAAPARHPRLALRRARLRILGWFVLIIAGAVLGGLLLQRQLLLNRLDDELNETMRQELRELELLSGGVDPATGQPFASVQRLFDIALDRNVPLDGEAVVTFVAGQPYAASPAGEHLYGSASFVEDVADTKVSVAGEVDTGIGRARYQARPVVAGGAGGSDGVFVAVAFAESERAEVDDAMRISALVAVAVLAVASGVAWIVAGRVLRPVREVTETARMITETDLRRRIPVQSDDEISQLAVTFNDMLDRLDDAFATQRAFIDDAGHELRTPVTIIQGHLDLLPDDPEERGRTLEIVQDELDRMTRIIDDLLLLARAEQPDFLRTGVVDVTALIEGVHARAGSISDRRWRLRPPPYPLQIEADRERLMQAMLNLVANVANHTDEGVTATIGASIGPGGTVDLWVRDTGPGLSDEDARRVFERFRRGSASRSSAHSAGAGLGLSIVAAVATAHGGTVRLETEIGKGATFTIVLPAGLHR